jgi:carboxymethylenebutenolidase
MVSRRDMLRSGGVAAAGYCLAADPVLAQAIKTDTAGPQAGDAIVKIGTYDLPVYYAQPAAGPAAPIVLVISEIWGIHAFFNKHLKA